MLCVSLLILPSRTFLKLMLVNRSIAPVSYSGRLRVNSTSAVVGIRGTRFRSWFPGLRNSGPSPVPLHRISRLLYSSGWLQITYKHTHIPHLFFLALMIVKYSRRHKLQDFWKIFLNFLGYSFFIFWDVKTKPQK